MKNNQVFKTNIFYHYAQQYMEHTTSDEELRKIDMTEEFWKEIDEEIKNDELIDININAKVRVGKSTVGIYLGSQIYKKLIKFKKRNSKEKFGMRNIARDQQEYSKIMRDDKTRNTVIVTDEINDLEGTGENVTIEKALLNDFSNIQAGRYVHRISCSPKGVADPNADVFLEIISIDRKNKITHAHLYYNMFRGGVEYMQLLGYVNFDVNELIETWEEKVKKHFLRNRKGEKESQIISEYKKKDFYTEYMVKKYEKMELITKEGILRPRMLEYARVITKIEQDFRGLCRYNVLNKDTIASKVKRVTKEYQIPTSILGEELLTREAWGLMKLWRSYFKVNEDYAKAKSKGEIEKAELLENMREEIMETIQDQVEELKRYEEIRIKYNETQ